MVLQSQLVAPIAGVVGALLGATLTQLLSMLRERLQWQREKESRSEERAREDRQRWSDERLVAYSDVLSSISEWRNTVAKSGQGAISGSQRTELRTATEKVNAARDRLDLFAPEKIRATARSVAASMLLYEMDRMMLETVDSNDSNELAKARSNIKNEVDQVYQRHHKLRDEIREDLGIADQDPDPHVTERRRAESQISSDIDSTTSEK